MPPDRWSTSEFSPTHLSIHLPKGFRLTLQSSEDHHVHPRTLVLNGLTRYDVDFYLDLARHFSPGASPSMGNDEVTTVVLRQFVETVLHRHPGLSLFERQGWETAMLPVIPPPSDK